MASAGTAQELQYKNIKVDYTSCNIIFSYSISHKINKLWNIHNNFYNINLLGNLWQWLNPKMTKSVANTSKFSEAGIFKSQAISACNITKKWKLYNLLIIIIIINIHFLIAHTLPHLNQNSVNN